MGWAISPARSRYERHLAQRVFGLTLVVLLHLLLLAALLQAVIHPATPRTVREIVFHLLPQTRHVTPPPPAVVPSHAQPHTATPPIFAPPPIVPPAAAPDLQGLGQNLFGCTTNSLATMAPEARSHCLSGMARTGDGIATLPTEHAKNPERWANAIKERNAPPGRIPCTYIAETPTIAGGAGGYKVPMIEMVCLHKLLSH